MIWLHIRLVFFCYSVSDKLGIININNKIDVSFLLVENIHYS